MNLKQKEASEEHAEPAPLRPAMTPCLRGADWMMKITMGTNEGTVAVLWLLQRRTLFCWSTPPPPPETAFRRPSHGSAGLLERLRLVLKPLGSFWLTGWWSPGGWRHRSIWGSCKTPSNILWRIYEVIRIVTCWNALEYFKLHKNNVNWPLVVSFHDPQCVL